ncbi:MAG TPA: alpha/beta fold hydrolase [Myxococcota bacterium]|nr:alpha/beta fold hydrolase [Myxococcota bacterium]
MGLPIDVTGAVERRIRDRDGTGWLWVYDVPGPSADAPPVLLVHGLGVTAHLTWRPSYAALAKHFRVITMDLPGHGRGRRTRRFSLEECADDAAHVLEALGIERCVIAGYSLGGPIAKLLWQRHRARVAGLVLAATAMEFLPGGRGRILRMLAPIATALVFTRPAAVRRELIERTCERLDRSCADADVATELSGHHLLTVLEAARAAVAFSSRSWAGAIDVPVAVIVIAEDDRIAPSRQRALAVAIPGASMIEVPGAHTACATSADTFVPALADACLGVWSRGGAIDR